MPVATASRWTEAGGVPVEVVVGAGHLLEWDTPGEVGTRLAAFLGGS
jgi:hypothetical protein